MDKKQYEAMSLIMAKGRKFLDEVYGLMKENGLFEQKYTARFCISDCSDVESINGEWLITAELCKAVGLSDFDERRATEMTQWNENEEGWRIMNDPICKSGPLQKDIDLSDLPSGVFGISEPESNGPATGETAEAVAESCNGSMWFSADDNDPPMVCRGDLNDDLAESDTGV